MPPLPGQDAAGSGSADVKAGTSEEEGPMKIQAAGASTTVNLEQFEKLLDKKLNPINDTISKLFNEMTMFKTQVREEWEGYGHKLTAIESESVKMGKRVQKLEDDMEALTMKHQTVGTSTGTENLTIVMGNIPNASSLEEAQMWISKRCKESAIPAPPEPYCKAVELSGLCKVFFKYASGPTHRINPASPERTIRKQNLGRKLIFLLIVARRNRPCWRLNVC